MNFEDIIFIGQFVILIIIMILKLINIMIKAEIYDIRVTLIGLIMLIMMYGIGLITAIINHTNTLMLMLFNLEKMFLILGIAFSLIEIFFQLSNTAIMMTGRHNAKEKYIKRKPFINK